MRQFIAFIVGVLAFTTVQAETTLSISGRVTDSASGVPLPGATVQILSTTKGTHTRNDGSFTLLGVPSGTLRLRISCMGYAADTVAVDEASAGRFVNVALSPKAVTMDQIVVAGEIGKGQARALSQQRAGGNITNIVSADQIGRFPDQNIGDAMKRIPALLYSTTRARRVSVLSVAHLDSSTAS